LVVSVDWNQIEDEGAIALADALLLNTTIVQINLG